MAYFSITRGIREGRTIAVYNGGEMMRDFTYIDDIVAGFVAVLDKAATPDPAFDPQAPGPGTSTAPYRVFNIGNQDPVRLGFMAVIEQALGLEAVKQHLPIQPGDGVVTHADVSALAAWTGAFRPGHPWTKASDGSSTGIANTRAHVEAGARAQDSRSA